MKTINRTFTASALSAAVAMAVNAQAQEPLMLEEVVVTAQKRVQSSQDVGLAISAFSGETMRERGITDGTDLARITPNMSIQNISGGGVPVVIVRGIGLQNFRINDSPTTSFYVDEVYQTSIAAVEFSMFDLERVEVLKGPQGGLYGRNTIGGAVQVISQRPTIGEGANGFATLAYGEYDRIEGEIGAGFDLGDNAAMRLSGRFDQSDERQWSSSTLGKDYGGDDRWAARAMLDWQPTDNVDLLFKIHGGADKSELPLLRSQGIYRDIGTGEDIGLPAPGVSGALLAGLTGSGASMLCDSVLSGKGADPRTCATLTGVTPEGYGQTRGDVWTSSTGDLAPELDNSWGGASLIATFDFQDYVLTSITAYDNMDYRRLNDADATPVEFQNLDYGTEITWWSQEFRLAYDGGNDVTWIAGLSYGEDELEESTVLYGAEGVVPVFFGGATFSPQDYDQDGEAWAVYGHLEWQFTDTWQFVGEARYSDETKSFKGGALLGFPDGSTAPLVGTDDEESFDDISGKLGLNWTPTDNMLLYGSISRGFKVGGFFGGFALDPAELEPYDSETMIAYEAGIKSDWLDNRLRFNASLFFYDREDVQMSAADVNDQVVKIARLTNIGDVESQGGELDLTWLATEHLTFQLGYGYTDSEITDSDFLVTSGINLLGGAPAEGANIPNYSKHSVNALGRWEQEIGDSLLGHIQLEYSYRSDQDLSIITQPKFEDPIWNEPGYDLWNLRLGIAAIDDQWRVQAFVENLADEEYRVLSRSDGLYGVHELYGEPRTWGVRFTYNWF